MGIRKSSQVTREIVSIETATSRRCGNSLRPTARANTKAVRPMQQADIRRVDSSRIDASTIMSKVPPKKAQTRAAATKTTAVSQPPLALPVALPASMPSVQEPQVRARLGVRQRLGELRAAIADGFLIQEPIYARPLWSSPDNSRLAYSFVLQHEESIRLITVPDGRTVQQFIREHDLQIDYRR
jgi:hypothetical protein